MAFRNIRPLHVLWQEGVTEKMLVGVKDGIRAILALAGVSTEIAIEYRGQRGKPDWLERSELINPYENLGWHLWYAQEKSQVAEHLNSAALLNSLLENPGYETNPRYELVVVKQPIHWSDDSTQANLGGVGQHKHGAIISLASKLHLLSASPGETDDDRKKRLFYFYLLTKMTTIHELSHTFGLCLGELSKNPTDEEHKKLHCQNNCVMYYKEDVELQLKIQHEPFCPKHLAELSEFFLAP